MDKEQEAVYAILRYDGNHRQNAGPEVTVTVKEVVRSLELAEAETARLNLLNDHKGVRYWLQYTRLYAEGKSAGTG